jgi:Ni/Fe-hydrogenase subunit HybB-like protein
VILSTLHQSSLGTLYLIVPEKLYPLWYTPLLPVFFFLSAIAVGLAMTIFESSMSSKHFGLQLELPVLQELGRVLVVVLGVYAHFALRGPGESRSAETGAASGIRDVSVLA